MKLLKIILVSVSFVFLTGFFPVISFLGPGITAISSGNVYKAGAQYLIDQSIKLKTGKNSLALVKEEVIKQNKRKNLNDQFKEIVKKRVKITHQKLAKQNEYKNSNKELRDLLAKRIVFVKKKLNKTNVNLQP